MFKFPLPRLRVRLKYAALALDTASLTLPFLRLYTKAVFAYRYMHQKKFFPRLAYKNSLFNI